MSLLELVGETMQLVLNEAIRLAPEWLRQHTKTEWSTRYGRRFDGYRLPGSHVKREELAVAITISEDGFYLLQVIHSAA